MLAPMSEVAPAVVAERGQPLGSMLLPASHFGTPAGAVVTPSQTRTRVTIPLRKSPGPIHFAGLSQLADGLHHHRRAQVLAGVDHQQQPDVLLRNVGARRLLAPRTRRVRLRDPGVAQRLGIGLIEKALTLASLPERGRVVPELSMAEVRKVYKLMREQAGHE